MTIVLPQSGSSAKVSDGKWFTLIKRPISRHVGRSAGFAYLPWLVAVGVVAVLIAVLIPFVANARENARRSKCAENLRQIGAALHHSAGDNRGNLPVHGTAPTWPWDISVELADTLLATGAVEQNNFYCPSGRYEEEELRLLWMHGVVESAHRQTGFRVTSYALLLPGAGRVLETHINSRLAETVTVVQGDAVLEIPASQRELAADAVLSAGGGPNASFHAIFQGRLPRPGRTNHLVQEKIPAGGNILFLDGHVEWREFDEMVDTRVVGRPIFWW